MKSLSYSRPLLIMMTGLPGSGKSFFSRQFAETFNAPLVLVDKIRFEIIDNPQYTLQEYGLLKRLAEQQLTELVKTKATIIVDGICNSQQDRSQLRQLAAHYGYDTLVVWVQTDEPTAKRRATARSPKRQGDELNQSLSPDTYATLCKRFFAPSGRENYVVISGKHAYGSQAKSVLKKLAEPRVQEADLAHSRRLQINRTNQDDRQLPKPKRNLIIN